MTNDGTGKSLSVLDADKHPDLAELCYKMVNSKPEFSAKGSVKAEKIDFIQLQAEFLAKQHEQNLFDRLIIAAPADVTTALRNALPENVNQLVSGELAEDLTMHSCDLIEEKLSALL